MTRLQQEQHRLYGTGSETSATGNTRGMVLELGTPADWSVLAKVWEGIQTQWAWPAPGIAVSGSDGLQLWFSFAQAISASDAERLLALMCQQHLADVAPNRIRAWADPAAKPTGLVQPPMQVGTDRWASFVSRDLASVFGNEPWLDMPPGEDAQADLLSRLRSIPPAEALAPLRTQTHQASTPLAEPAAPHACDATRSTAWENNPRQFLLQVMNNPAVDMATRVEAAKALLTTAAGPSHP